MKINKSEYEDLVRDSERMAVVTALVNNYEFVSVDLLKIVCGLQTEEPLTVPEESAEDANKKAVEKLRLDMLNEDYELREDDCK